MIIVQEKDDVALDQGSSRGGGERWITEEVGRRYLFCTASITKYHTLDGLHMYLFSHDSGG